MGEGGFDFSSLMGMFGGGGGDAAASFGANMGQPQLSGVFGGTPQTPGGNFMSGTMQTMPTMQNFDSGTLPSGFQAPGSFGMSGYGQGGGGGLGLLGMGGAGQQQQQQHAPMQMAGGGGGGNMKGLFSALMRSPNLTHQALAMPNLLGNSIVG